MITPRKTQSAIVLIFALTCTLVMGSEPNQPAMKIEFLKSKSVLELTLEQRPPINPSYAATFTVQWRFKPAGDPNAADILSTPTGKSFSALQRELLKSDKDVWLDTWISKTYISRHDVPSGAATYKAFAVTEADAKRMARAVLESLIREETETARRMKKDLLARLTAMQSKLREDMAKAKKEIEAKESKVTSAKEKYEDAVENSPYSLHPINEVPREVLKTISEMDKMLDVLNIEILGIQSKLSAIKEYENENEVMRDNTLRLTLRELAIRQEIELVGAESRKQAIMSVKRREEALYNLFEIVCDLEQQVRGLEKSVEKSEQEIKRLDREIDNIGPGELTFYIASPRSGKKVAIHPVGVKIKDLYPLYLD